MASVNKMRIIFKKQHTPVSFFLCIRWRYARLNRPEDAAVWETSAAGRDWLDIAYIPFSAYCQGMHFYIQTRSVRTAIKVIALRKTYCKISRLFRVKELVVLSHRCCYFYTDEGRKSQINSFSLSVLWQYTEKYTQTFAKTVENKWRRAPRGLTAPRLLLLWTAPPSY